MDVEVHAGGDVHAGQADGMCRQRHRCRDRVGDTGQQFCFHPAIRHGPGRTLQERVDKDRLHRCFLGGVELGGEEHDVGNVDVCHLGEAERMCIGQQPT